MKQIERLDLSSDSEAIGWVQRALHRIFKEEETDPVRRERYLRVARRLVFYMDELILGKVGLDPIIDTIADWTTGLALPIIGSIPADVLTSLPVLYIYWVGIKLGLPRRKLRQILWIMAVDAGMSWVWIVGNIGDAVYRACSRSLRIIEEHLAEQAALPDPTPPALPGPDLGDFEI